ncbi:hypothetical protein [Methylocapsa acidiphila]|uniref:hypothetical protein n=1 Tax=Methylocapsa acidiphila TaxID=133552 RepID=UPI00040BE49D|nr:hypothetical protein [Methylocapsa acidiphila]
MQSFQITDPSSTAALADVGEAGRRVGGGSITFVVENLTNANRTASLSILPEVEADLPLFKLVEAAPTTPSMRSVDLAPRQVLNVIVAIKAPLGPEPRRVIFRLRAALESDPDNDAVDSRPVAIEINRASAAEPPPPKKPFPWLALAAGALLLIAVGGLAAYVLKSRPKPPQTMSFDEFIAFAQAQHDAFISIRGKLDFNACNGSQSVARDPTRADLYVITYGVKIDPPCLPFTPEEMNMFDKRKVVQKRMEKIVAAADHVKIDGIEPTE